MGKSKEPDKLRLPTAKNVYEDTGLLRRYLLNIYFLTDMRALKKHMDELPIPHIERQEEISNIIERYQSAFDDFAKTKPKSGQKALREWYKWKEIYRATLEKELRENLAQNKWEHEFSKEWESYRTENRNTILRELEAIFYNLPEKQILKFTYYFEGYAALFIREPCLSDVLLECFCILSDTARNQLRQHISCEELLVDKDYIYWMADNIAWCNKIIRASGTELRKSVASAWEHFKKKCEALEICRDDQEYTKFLGISVLVVIFEQHVIQDADLKAVIDCAMFLDRTQQEEVLQTVTTLLRPENIRSPYTLEDGRKILKDTRLINTRVRLENRFHSLYALKTEEDIFQEYDESSAQQA
ncbi:MAG: hypothetical protein E6626_10725 [Flavonifractor plautii]|nr:hypothetical protein [Flavonifractor plautii]MDU6291374.1 hypothetical protein [Flavonifractor plautii]MDU6344436.1 hypothetical protein [Flavonifractor plautii]